MNRNEIVKVEEDCEHRIFIDIVGKNGQDMGGVSMSRMLYEMNKDVFMSYAILLLLKDPIIKEFFENGGFERDFVESNDDKIRIQELPALTPGGFRIIVKGLNNC